MTDLVELWELHDFCALIVKDDGSPFVFTNQVGGLTCGHPALRGHVIPLPPWWAPPRCEEDPLWDAYYNKPDGEAYARLQHWIETRDYCNAFFEPAPFEEVSLIAEAWIPVRVRSDIKDPLLSAVAGRVGVITYTNSD